MSGILSRMKAVARNVPLPLDEEDCEICRMLAAQSTVVEERKLPDGSVLELRQMHDGWQRSPEMEHLRDGHGVRKGGAS